MDEHDRMVAAQLIGRICMVLVLKPGEFVVDAAQRVVRERDEAVKQLAATRRTAESLARQRRELRQALHEMPCPDWCLTVIDQPDEGDSYCSKCLKLADGVQPLHDWPQVSFVAETTEGTAAPVSKSTSIWPSPQAKSTQEAEIFILPEAVRLVRIRYAGDADAPVSCPFCNGEIVLRPGQEVEHRCKHGEVGS